MPQIDAAPTPVKFTFAMVSLGKHCAFVTCTIAVNNRILKISSIFFMLYVLRMNQMYIDKSAFLEELSLIANSVLSPPRGFMLLSDIEFF